MLQQLLPLLVIAGIFGIYTLVQAIRYVWNESMRITAEALDAEALITNITPTETPFMRALKDTNAD